MKNILITGGAGFIGSNLSLYLLNKGYEVTVLDNLSPQIHGDNPEESSPLYNSIKDKVKFIKGTVTSRTDLEYSIENQDVIVHLAAETGTGQSMYEIERYSAVNIQGTALLLDVLSNKYNKVKKILVASSRAIYGEGAYFCKEHRIVYPLSRNDDDMLKGDFECKCPYCNKLVDLISTSEESKLHPTSIYGITKQNQEQMVMTVAKSIGIESVALRYQNVYGPGQSLSNPYTGILSIFSTRLKNNEEINVFEDGLESRDFIYIDDVISATVLALESNMSNGQVYNVGTGIPTNVNNVARVLKKILASNSTIQISGRYRVGDIRHNIADITKIKNELGFTPKFLFSEGIEHFCSWVNKQQIFTDNYESSIEEMKRKGLYK